MSELCSSKYVKTLPYTTRTLYFFLALFYILDIYFEKWSSQHMTSDLESSIFNYQVWRILFYFVYEPSLAILVLSIIHFQMFLPRFEHQNGSVVLIYEFFAISICIEILILSLEGSLYLLEIYQLTAGWSLTYTSGVAGLTVNTLYKFLHFNLRKEKRSASKQGILTFLYPFLLAVIFCLCEKELRIDAIFGYFLAVVECTFFKGGIVFFTPDTYTKKQALVNMFRLNRIPCCGWSPLNEGKIKPNSKSVVEANQFYRFTTNQMDQVSQSDFSEIETERGSFGRNIEEMTEDETEGRDEKWEKEQIVE